MKNIFLFSTGLLAAAGLAYASIASAQEAPSAVAAQAAPATGADEVIDTGQLADLSGGDGVSIEMLTAQTLSAVNSGNTVQGESISSGQVNLGENAFNGFDGIGNFVINTGHNNNLQSSVNVNIVLAP